MRFQTLHLPSGVDVRAPDGTDVRILLGLEGGGMAHFALGPNETSVAVTHRTVGEIWYFLKGRGEVWRKQDDLEETVKVEAGICITIPLGTSFQLRCVGSHTLEAVAVTMPPWPGEGEAIRVRGPWPPTLNPG